jgi:type II secretion system protein G
MRVGKKFRHRIGFTLVEILAVMVIIAISFLLFGVMRNYRDNNIRENVVHEELALLNCAIEIFKSDNSTYPICDSQSIDANAKDFFKKISPKIETLAEYHKWHIVDEKLVDPWNNPYVYRCTSANPLSYELLSMGPNGRIDERELIDDVYSR